MPKLRCHWEFGIVQGSRGCRSLKVFQGTDCSTATNVDIEITTSIDESEEYYDDSKGYHTRDDFERGEEFESAFILRQPNLERRFDK